MNLHVAGCPDPTPSGYFLFIYLFLKEKVAKSKNAEWICICDHLVALSDQQYTPFALYYSY